MGNSSKRDTKKVARAELARKVLELRKAGASHDQIADQLGLANRSVSWKLFSAALHEIIREPAQDVLALELDRLDAMLLGCWTKAKSGDTQAIDRVIRIMDRRTAYLGLDAPKSNSTEMVISTTKTGEVGPEAAARLVREMFGEKAARPDESTETSDVAEGGGSAGEVSGDAPEE